MSTRTRPKRTPRASSNVRKETPVEDLDANDKSDEEDDDEEGTSDIEEDVDTKSTPLPPTKKRGRSTPKVAEGRSSSRTTSRTASYSTDSKKLINIEEMPTDFDEASKVQALRRSSRRSPRRIMTESVKPLQPNVFSTPPPAKRNLKRRAASLPTKKVARLASMTMERSEAESDDDDEISSSEDDDSIASDDDDDTDESDLDDDDDNEEEQDDTSIQDNGVSSNDDDDDDDDSQPATKKKLKWKRTAATVPSKVKAVRKKGTTIKKRKYKRLRGALVDRTCPKCEKVFTSVNGAAYHAKRNVCNKPKVGRKNSNILFHTLHPGEQFVTRFGIAEVVDDTRENPTAIKPKDCAQRYRTYKNAKLRMGRSKVYLQERVENRARRMAVNQIYRDGNLNAMSVISASLPHCRATGIAGGKGNGGTPKKGGGFHPYDILNGKVKYFPKVARPSLKAPPEDPLAPISSYPDRIVECILVPDQRELCVGGKKGMTREGRQEIKKEEPSRDTEKNQESDKPDSKKKTPVKIFLRRRQLVEPYLPGGKSWICEDCGQQFHSDPGLSYHCNRQICIARNRKMAEDRAKEEKMIQERLDAAAIGNYRFKPGAAPLQPKLERRRLQLARKRERPVYPEVMLALGFQVVKSKLLIAPTDDTKTAATKIKTLQLEAKSYRKDETIAIADIASSQINITNLHPDRVQEVLRERTETQERKLDDARLGSVYKAVMKSLQFKDPKKPSAKKRQRKRVATMPRKLSAKKSGKVKIKPSIPLPPIVDTSALVDEIASGRFPSFKKYEGDQSADLCGVCKEGGTLVCCDYCSNAVHFECLLTKFTVKAPEPDDDFMCNRCIGLIQTKRKRAEKRRLDKQARDEEKAKLEKIEEAKKKAIEESGQEYALLAAQGQEVSELVELLHDATMRLNQSLEMSKINDLRRSMMM